MVSILFEFVTVKTGWLFIGLPCKYTAKKLNYQIFLEKKAAPTQKITQTQNAARWSLVDSITIAFVWKTIQRALARGG